MHFECDDTNMKTCHPIRCISTLKRFYQCNRYFVCNCLKNNVFRKKKIEQDVNIFPFLSVEIIVDCSLL